MTSPLREEVVVLDLPSGSDYLSCLATLNRPLPSDGPPRGGAVLLHGWAGPRAGSGRLLLRWARRLAAAGWYVLRPDLPGRGESDGDPGDACLDDMIACALACLERLEQEGCAERVLGGICSGANVAVGAAAVSSVPVDRLALLSLLPFADIVEPGVTAGTIAPPPSRRGGRWAKRWARAREYGRKALSAETWGRMRRGEINWRGVGRTLKGDVAAAASEAAVNPKDSQRDLPARWAAEGRRTPALFLYGTADPEAKAAATWYGDFCLTHGIGHRTIWIEGADHNFSGRDWADEALGVADSWISASALPNPLSPEREKRL